MKQKSKYTRNDKQPEKRGKGRPTKYSMDMCEKVIRLGKRGYVRAEMAGALGVRYKTLNDWYNNNQDFRNALNEALMHSEAWWIKKLRKNLVLDKNEKFNTTGWIFFMKNAFKWRNEETLIQEDQNINHNHKVEIVENTEEKTARIIDILKHTGISAGIPGTKDTNSSSIN